MWPMTPTTDTSAAAVPMDALSTGLLALLNEKDAIVARILADEATRQATTIELIARTTSVPPLCTPWAIG